MQIDPRTLNDLAFGEILRALAHRARTEPGRLRAGARPFLATAEEIRSALDLVEEARRLAQEQLALPVAAVTDVRSSVERAAKSAMLEPRELIAIAQVLFAFIRARELLEPRAGSVPSLATIARRLPLLERLAERLERSFEGEAEISDRASPELREARDRARALHRRIKSRLDEMLHDERFIPNLRENYYSVRNGRYVVPVLAQHRAEVPGIVHNASQSGQTLFVEPEPMIGLGNDLAIAQSLVLEEERKVLQELSNQVGREAAKILEGVEAIAELDEAEAAARLAADLDAHPPEIEPEGGRLELRGLRHPRLLLKGDEVVANDVVLEGDARTLVISGPNAGGKTVTLTAVGTSALMLAAGLPIPASPGSRLPLYGSVHSTIGDAQDLSKGLSTFSAHVVELREITRQARRGSLALIDEIAADTNPREGAALAVAVLEDLIERGAVVLVTTHLEELKALAHLDPRFVNARVGFDPRRMMPTYKLQIGAAGASSAIEVAARMGLPEKITARARDLALNAGGPLAQALTAAEEERRKLAEQLDRAERSARDAEEAKARLEAERRRFEEERQQTLLRHQEELKAVFDRATEEVRTVIAQLRERQKVEYAEQARAQFQQQAQAVQAELQKAKAHTLRAQAPDAPLELKVGGWVHHTGLGRDVEVLEVIDDEVLVAAGALKIRVPVQELAPAQKNRPKAKFPEADKQQRALKKAEQARPAEVTAAHFRCDVRGLRADDALRQVEQFLDRTFRGGEEMALILHGHGTGALKQSIRDYLDRSPYVRMFRPGDTHEGGDGVTVVALRA